MTILDQLAVAWTGLFTDTEVAGLRSAMRRSLPCGSRD